MIRLVHLARLTSACVQLPIVVLPTSSTAAPASVTLTSCPSIT